MPLNKMAYDDDTYIDINGKIEEEEDVEDEEEDEE